MTTLYVTDANTGDVVSVDTQNPSGTIYVQDQNTGDFVLLDLSNPAGTLNVVDQFTGDVVELDYSNLTGTIHLVDSNTGNIVAVDLLNPTGLIYVHDDNTGDDVQLDLSLDSVIPIGNVLTRKWEYYKRVKALFGSALIAHWPLWDTSTTVATDISGNGHNGSIEGATPDAFSLAGRGRYGFDGINDAGVLYSAGLASAYNVSEGMISVWFKMPTANDWENSTLRFISSASGTNYEVSIFKDGAANYITMRIKQNNVTKDHVISGFSSSGWQNLAITWSVSNNRNRFYRNGKLMNEQAATAHVGTITGWRIGELAGFKWLGGIGSVILTNREPTPEEVAMVASETRIYRLSILGDSISSGTVGEWAYGVMKTWHDGEVNLYNHAVTGNTIVSNMDGQTSAAASDNADVIIILLGTNDNNAGDMSILQAEYEENIAELKASNPNARIYSMNVLRQWLNNTNGAEINKSNIRSAISAACASQGITCWDTFTTPWVAQNQTADGIHPNATGHAAIVTQVLSRI